jgi:hypothetical protein
VAGRINPVSGYAQGVILTRNADASGGDEVSPSDEADDEQEASVGMRP